jgi:hypothetical protein
MAQEYTIDINALHLTNRDMIDFKRVTGKSLVQALGPEAAERMKTDPDFEVLAALSWVVLRKSNPDFTFDDALDSEIDASPLIDALAPLVNPTEPATKAGKRQTKSS